MTDQVKDKLVTPDEAVRHVKPGDKVFAGVLTTGPKALSEALIRRAGELPGVTVVVSATAANWDQPDVRKNFRFRGSFLGLLDRALFKDGLYDYIAFPGFRENRLPSGFDEDYDVALIPVTPPDAEGWCSFGLGVWYGPTVAARAKKIIAEIVPMFPRTLGDRIHVSQIHHFVNTEGGLPIPPLSPPSPDAAETIETVCKLVASELVQDGATLQLGVGDIPPKLLRYLGNKHDLGMHSELIPSGMAALVEGGVMTGARKELDTGKVVGTQLGLLQPDEVKFVSNNPRVLMREAGYVNDLRVLLRFETFTAVNSALMVDFTGNVAAEGIGTTVYSGPGGQPTFAYAASVTCGRSIITLPSSLQGKDQVRKSRIVPAFPPGTTITTHRGSVDFVVTEHGIARLGGRPLQERIRELIGIAHPELRDELRKQAAAMYGVSV